MFTLVLNVHGTDGRYKLNNHILFKVSTNSTTFSRIDTAVDRTYLNISAIILYI